MDYKKLQEKIDTIARNEPLPPVNEEEGPYGTKDSNYEIIMGFVNQWTEAGQPDDYMDDLVAYVKKTIPDSKDWNYAASLIKDGVESYQNREYGTSSLMGLRNNTESVEEAVEEAVETTTTPESYGQDFFRSVLDELDQNDAPGQATVSEATQGPGVDAVMELIDMGVSKEDLFDQMMRDHSDDELLAFADDYRRMNDFPGMED